MDVPTVFRFLLEEQGGSYRADAVWLKRDENYLAVFNESNVFQKISVVAHCADIQLLMGSMHEETVREGIEITIALMPHTYSIFYLSDTAMGDGAYVNGIRQYAVSGIDLELRGDSNMLAAKYSRFNNTSEFVCTYRAGNTVYFEKNENSEVVIFHWDEMKPMRDKLVLKMMK